MMGRLPKAPSVCLVALSLLASACVTQAEPTLPDPSTTTSTKPPPTATTMAPADTTTVTTPVTTSTREPTTGGPAVPGWLDHLESCGPEDLLTVPPIAPDEFRLIIPLGNLNPPGHTIPTDHVYYWLPLDAQGVSEQTTVHAPGDIHVLGIDTSTATFPSGLSHTDYSLTFSPCRERVLKFGHLTGLAPVLEQRLADSAGRCDGYDIGDTHYDHCSHFLDLPLSAGDVVGAVGGPSARSHALDLWAFDFATPPLLFANTDRYPSEADMVLHVVCPLALFGEDARLFQESRLAGYSGEPRSVEPRCGEVNQDIPGTAQGAWFTGGATMHQHWEGQLALVHDNADPTVAAISVGGEVARAGVWYFVPEREGTFNREFGAVEPGSEIHCYGEFFSLPTKPDEGRPGRFLVQLRTANELMIEFQSGTCSDPAAFSDPVVYER